MAEPKPEMLSDDAGVLAPDAIWVREDHDGVPVHTLIVLDELVHKTNTGLGFPLNWEVEI